MSGKLDQSLDDILKDRRSNVRRSRRVTRAKPAVVSAPAAGVKKNVRAAAKVPAKKAAATAAPTGPSNTGPSKIIVSNLPTDVNETQIKEYFIQTIGAVKKVWLTYGPSGQSRGIATVLFADAKSASESAKLLNGTKVDGRPMRVEVILGAKDAPSPPPVKTLSQRVSQVKQAAAKNAPKSAAAKPTPKTKKRTPRGRNAGRGKPKTTEELDAEMKDYFDTTAAGVDGNASAATNGGAVQPVANGGEAMEDEIL